MSRPDQTLSAMPSRFQGQKYVIRTANILSKVGCTLAFLLGDVLGRRRMIWLAMALIIVGASLQASAYTLTHLIIGRVITGFGTGIDSSTVPMYQSELSKKESRGKLVSWEIWFIGIGISLAYWIVSIA